MSYQYINRDGFQKNKDCHLEHVSCLSGFLLTDEKSVSLNNSKISQSIKRQSHFEMTNLRPVNYKEYFCRNIVLSVLSILFFYNSTYAQSSLVLRNDQIGIGGDFDFESLSETSKNFVEVTYGYSSLFYSNENFNSSFSPSTLTEIKLGTSTIKPEGNYSILSFDESYFFSSLLSSYNKEDSKVSFELWRLGAGARYGYGYNIKNNFQVIPYYHFGLAWSRGNFEEPKLSNDLSDRNYLDKFHNTIRFGTTNSAGLQIKVSQLISFGAEYETDIIFPKHLAFKQFGSFFIELMSQTGIDYLTKGVLLKAIPQGVPVFYFLLKNGLSYLFYSLKEEEMNWPFESEAPLRMETLKFNLKITL